MFLGKKLIGIQSKKFYYEKHKYFHIRNLNSRYIFDFPHIYFEEKIFTFNNSGQSKFVFGSQVFSSGPNPTQAIKYSNFPFLQHHEDCR